ncbi:MAG TPA: NAD(P)/FAD-dependent oxidoreductase [Spirochaetia bacterium]|nr:NAD(P)/FAD-dependent oxidoreductase [Spirochaetia bacterium]
MKSGSDLFDVLVIGAGVSGASIARRLSSYALDVALVDRECDVSFGTSKSNSGIIHGGFHHSSKTLKARLEVRGNALFDQLQAELGFPFRRCGILVVATHNDEMKVIGQLYAQGVENGSVGIEMCSRRRMLELEPLLSPDVLGGLHAPSGGIIEPYRFVFCLVESARKNGVSLFTGFEAERGVQDGGRWSVHSRDGRTLKATWVVNAAGLFADDVSRAFGAEEYSIMPRKGEYFLLDRSTPACPSRVLFPVPSHNSKGVLVIPTVEGTVLVGPTASEIRDKRDLSTTAEELEKIFDYAKRLVPLISQSDVISSFAGLRPVLEGEDFFISFSSKVPRLVHVAGIQSPGLTASPAVGEYVTELLGKGGVPLMAKKDFDPYIERIPRLREMSAEEAEKLINADGSYGNIVCRCEKVSEAEVVAAVRREHTTLDGIKYFTRAGMGRCQGGFCTSRILKIIARETGLPYERITKKGKDSYLLEGRL